MKIVISHPQYITYNMLWTELLPAPSKLCLTRRLFVCRSVWWLATSSKKVKTAHRIFMKILPEMYLSICLWLFCVKFCTYLGDQLRWAICFSGSPSLCFTLFCWHSFLLLYSWLNKLIDWNWLIWTEKSSLNFGSHADSGSGPVRVGGGLRSEFCCVII